MMRTFARAAFVTVAAAASLASAALAVPPGRTVQFDAGPGRVVFSGSNHSRVGLKCHDCHSRIFKMRHGSFSMPLEMHAALYCGQCHDGGRAFEANDNCGRCHKK